MNPFRLMLDRFAHWYFACFPLDRGKWHVWEWMSPFLKPGTSKVEMTIHNGIRMKLNLADHIDHVIYYWNSWEPYETWAVQVLLRPGDTFVDVGANIGYFTLVASRLVGRQGRVFSFEPVPRIAKRLAENVDLNHADNVVIHEYAVSDVTERVKIGEPVGTGPGMSTMRTNEAMRETWEVPAVRLDDVLPRDRRIRLIKIDVEGAELRVLKGFARYLQSGHAPYILCEVKDSFLKELGSSTDELNAWMLQLGYRAYSCKHRRFAPIGVAAMKNPSHASHVNVLFSPTTLPH